MSPTDRRTVGELLADCDALARETLLDATFDRAPAMVRSWNQLVGSADELWATLPSVPGSRSGSDPMERLRVVGEAIGRSVRAGHWPGRGPTDDTSAITSPARDIWSNGTAALPSRIPRKRRPSWKSSKAS